MLSQHASTYLIISAFALAIYVLLRRRRPLESEWKPRRFESIRPLAEGKDDRAEKPLELLRWQVEMHDTARELKAELDSKLSALQALVIMAKRESERLETAIRKAESLDLPHPSDSLALLERLGEPMALEDAHALGDAAARLAGDSAIPDPFAGEQTELALSNLAAKGYSAQEIARRLNLPLGEVELRLNLLVR
jgi:hypothetical protein